MRADPPSSAVKRRASTRKKPSRRNAARSAPSKVWSRYRDNAARHLMGIARDLQNRSTHHLTEERGYRDLRPSLGPVLALIAIESRPLGALARQLAISPQACSQLVNLGESAGFLERRPDPEDRRSRIAVLTPHGQALVEDAAGILLTVEGEYRELLGVAAYSRLAKALGTLFRGLDLPARSDSASSSSSAPSLGVLPLISVRVQQDLMEATTARGHAGLKMSHAQVLPLIGPEGARVNQLARIQRVSRQAISTTARDLEELGYLQREADPRDRRGVVFQLTARGASLIEASVAALDELDDTFRDLLGVRGLRSLQSAARELYQALHLEEEIFEARLSQARTDESAIDGNGHATGTDLQRLAASLRRRLSPKDAGRLAALLEAGN
ncbi:MAG: MarR family transcriptional regulator [bacterium]|nr:MarR family transcriptional regulator [bacterium]